MADNAPIELQVITPEGAALRAQVDELTAPSVDGDFGVLAGHRPLIAALRTGIVTYRKGSEQQQIAVGPGFVEVTHDRALLLTSSFCRAEDVDLAVARRDLSETDDALQTFDGEPGGPEHGVLIRRERWAAVRLELGGDPPPPTINTIDEFRMLPHGSYDQEESGEPEPQ
jgi:F-type H+-transporting ATPase subunit epsilon